MDAQTALAIINEYKAGGFEDDVGVPEDEGDLIARGEYLWEEAKAAFEAGERDNTIQTIIFLGDSPILTAKDETSDGAKNAFVEVFPGTDNPDWAGEGLAERENLPVPQHIEGEADPMPRDLTAMDDKKVRKLSGEYNAYLSRVTYLLGVELGDLKRAQHLLDAARASALRSANVVDSKTEKPKLAKVIEAEILADKEVSALTEAVTNHEATVDMLKALQSIYSGNVSLLSREWTMRQNEWEKGR